MKKLFIYILALCIPLFIGAQGINDVYLGDTYYDETCIENSNIVGEFGQLQIEVNDNMTIICLAFKLDNIITSKKLHHIVEKLERSYNITFGDFENDLTEDQFAHVNKPCIHCYSVNHDMTTYYQVTTCFDKLLFSLGKPAFEVVFLIADIENYYNYIE